MIHEQPLTTDASAVPHLKNQRRMKRTTMSDIPYDFHRNIHSLEGARRGLAQLLAGHTVESLLDVGAGIGTWLNAARELGIRDVA